MVLEGVNEVRNGESVWLSSRRVSSSIGQMERVFSPAAEC